MGLFSRLETTMTVRLIKLELKQHYTSPAEQARLAQLTGHRCMNCDEQLTMGEYEAAGMCSACYWTPEDLAEAAEHEAAMEAV